MNKKTVGVVFGGRSLERNISVDTAHEVISAIDKLEGYSAYPIFLTFQSTFVVGNVLRSSKTFNEDEQKILRLTELAYFYRAEEGLFIKTQQKGKKSTQEYERKIDVIFLAVHGQNTEDGTLAGFFGTFNIPFTGSGVLSSAIGMNKHIAKCLVRDNGIQVVHGVHIRKEDYDKEKEKTLRSILSSFKEPIFPLFSKPVDSGSSIGIKEEKGRSECLEELKERIEYAFKFSDGVLIEEFIKDRQEISCAVFGDGKQMKMSCCKAPELLSDSDARTTSQKYPARNNPDKKMDVSNMQSKDRYHVAGAEKTSSNDELIKRLQEIDPQQESEIKKLAGEIFNILFCAGMVRIDFFLTPDGVIYFNEINTIPGSFCKDLWGTDNSEYINLIKRLIELAEEKHESCQKIIGSNQPVYEFE